VSLAFAALGDPQLREAVARARPQAHLNGARVVVASYLLADGLFQQRLHSCGADLVSQPLGTHPGLARLIANQFRRAIPPVLAPTARHASRRSSPRQLVRGRTVRPNSAA
jgi:sirohydrochlorin ferrochelatase